MHKKTEQIDNTNTIKKTFSHGVIYVYSIPDANHKGRLKIGSATITSQNPTEEDIVTAAHNRIKQQTKTADISYKLEYSTLAVTNDNVFFSDYDVHEVLKRSGYKRKSENAKNSHSEWFQVSLEIAQNAIQATKEGRKALTTSERVVEALEFPFRPNQLDAIDQTTKAIRRKHKHFLWNAKMRFGKTSAAMQVAKENKMKKVLIVTHRPSVSADWYDDFNKVLSGANYEYASKTEGEDIATLLKGDKSFVYFASLQDLRLSKRVIEDESVDSKTSGFDKNDEIFDADWDMLIVDEAHEGTQSNLGDATFSKIPTNFTLQLSGTPFNILHKHKEEDIYTWDYVMEQEAKHDWDNLHPGAPNPYAELPSLSIFTYDVDTFASHIGNLGDGFHDSIDGAFKFHEFFRVHKDDQGNEIAKFVHEPMIKKFLDLLVNDKLKTKFPYATEEYRNYNKHSLWLLPNRVKMIEAMELLLKSHNVFGSNEFGIVNISGNNHDGEDKDAKKRVTAAIDKHEYTITLTGQRLTTGASIKEWTAIFMMSDTNSATTYLQTAFRCQTPARIDGQLKTQGYVFDFAPDRTLKLIAEAVELNHKSGKTNSPEQKEAMRQFLNFCPILAAEGGKMKPYDVGSMLTQLKKAIIERVSRNGFDDPKLYNDELLQLDELDIAKFNDLKEIIGKSNTERINEIEINSHGMDNLQKKQAEEAERKKRQKEGLSEEQKEALKKLQEARKQKKSAMSILRAVSIRMPMLVYGANVSIQENITLQKFIDIVDNESWQEFMPAGLSKEGFGEFTKYYDEDVFKGVAHSIRAKAFDCDDLLPTERIQAIAEIFSTFKNPDKETVLTPWNVVNMHMTKAFGGHDFTSSIKDKKGNPEWKSREVDTSIWEQDDTKILEINSKSGLYPLLAAYDVYTRQLKKKSKKINDQEMRKIWDNVLTSNIYVLCKSPMAQSITQRTLAGYSGAKTNIIYIENLVKKLQHKDDFKEYDFKKELLTKFNLNSNMKFTAVVGNPPYQENNEERNRDDAIYHYFVDEAYKLSDKVSLITPARFLFNVGSTPEIWNKKMLNDNNLTILFYERKSSKIFPNTDIKGGIAIIYHDVNKDYGPIRTFTRYSELDTILKKVERIKDLPEFGTLMFVQTKFNLKQLYKDYPQFKLRLGGNGKERRLISSIFEVLPEIFTDKKPQAKNSIQIYGRENGKRIYKHINSDYLELIGNIDKYKVFVPAANGSGEFGEALSTPIIGNPLIGHTQTFISIGSFDTRFEAEAVLKFLKGKFARTMFGILKTTQNNKTKNVWSKIPMQNFTDESDIDWTKSITDIDQQLYKKYKLDKKEIEFIESHVKPMV